MKAKKFLLPLLAMFIIGLTAGCTREDASVSYLYTVTASQWVTSATTPYYYATFENYDITPDVENHGMVVAYVLEDGRWNQLPYVFPYYSAAEDATWGENYRFDWTTNEVTFIVQDLDGGMPEDMANIPTCYFKVCVLK